MYVKLFVGNLPWSMSNVDLEDLFNKHGAVQSARVITDRDTGRSRGFGFVEMEVDNLAQVINSTNGLEIDGRQLRVNEAKERGNMGGGGGGFRRDNRRSTRRY
ncbi:MAG: RNA-binding protein [Chloroflexaceae bacterium]|nr:RNA-binding protein [Chloroflexaceae bacterium]